MCYTCDFTTLNEPDVRVHIVNVHGGYECEICGVKTNTLGRLNHHKLMHKELGFNCDKCEYKGRRKAHLREHQMTHHGSLIFDCDLCDKSFNSGKSLKGHKSNKHLSA